MPPQDADEIARMMESADCLPHIAMEIELGKIASAAFWRKEGLI
jgi:hypothetical protein